MPDPNKKKVDSVYDALSQDPNYEGIGTREQFAKAMGDSATARRVHDALSKDENYEGIGNFDQFYKAMNDSGQPAALVNPILQLSGQSAQITDNEQKSTKENPLYSWQPYQKEEGNDEPPPVYDIDPSKYETKLSPDQEKGFQGWMDNYHSQGKLNENDYQFYKKNGFGYDYDMRAAYLKGVKPVLNKYDGKWHMDDYGKKPNEAGFSIYSMYNGVNGMKGGTWKGNTFIPPTDKKDINALNDFPIANQNNIAALSPELSGQIDNAKNLANATANNANLSSDIKSSTDDANNFAKNVVGKLSDDGTGYVDANGNPITKFQPGQIVAVPKDQKLADGNTYDTGFMQNVVGLDGTTRWRKVGAPDPSFSIAKQNPDNAVVTRFKGVKQNADISTDDVYKDLGEDKNGNPITGGDAYWNDKPALKTFVRGSLLDGGGKQMGMFIKTHQDLAATLEKEAESTPHMMESLQGQYGLLTKSVVQKYDLDNSPFAGNLDQMVDAPAFYKNLDAINKNPDDKDAKAFFSQPNNMRVLSRMKNQEQGQKILNGIGSLFPNVGENEQKIFDESMAEQPWYQKYLANPAKSLYNGALDALSKLDKTAGDIMDTKGTDSQEILKNASYNQELDQSKFKVPQLQEIDPYTGERKWGNTIANFNNQMGDMTGSLAPTMLTGGDATLGKIVGAMAFGSQSYQTTLADYREKGVPEESAQIMALVNGGMMAVLARGLGGEKSLEGFNMSENALQMAFNPETKAAAMKLIVNEAMDYAKKEGGKVLTGAAKGAMEMQAIGAVNSVMNTIVNNKNKTNLNEDMPSVSDFLRNALSFGIQQGATHALGMARLSTDVKKESWRQNAIYQAASENPTHSITQLHGLLESLPSDSPLRSEVEDNIAMVGKFAAAKFPKSMDAAQKTVAFDLSQQIDAKKKEIESVDEHYQAPLKTEVKELQAKMDNVVANPIVARAELSQGQADIKNILGEKPAEEPNKLQVGKPIIEPSKPITEMTSDEIYDHAKEVKAALKKQDLEFADKTEAEKEAGGYNDTIDNVSDLRDIAQKVNFVENSENINDLAGSVRSVVVGMDSAKPSDEALAVLNAAKKKAVELGIEPKDLMKDVLDKVGSEHADMGDASDMMHSVFDKLTKPTVEVEPAQKTIEQPEEKPINSNVKYNEDGSIEHTTHDGKYKLTTKDGTLTATFAKDGKEVGKDTKRKIIAAAVDAHDFSGGERAEFPEDAHMDEKQSDLHTIEHTTSPSEIAQTFLRQEPDNSGVAMSEKEAAIDRLGVGKIHPDSFAKFDDRNNFNNDLARTYLNKNGSTLDEVAHEASTDTLEVTPQDVADYMKRFPNAREEKTTLKNNQVADAAKEKFLSLTGLPLDEKTAKKAIDQEYDNFDKEYQKWSLELQQKQAQDENEFGSVRTEDQPTAGKNDGSTAESLETTGDAQQAESGENTNADGKQVESDNQQHSGQTEVDETSGGDDREVAAKAFESKVDEAASKIKNLLSSNVIRELKAQGKDIKSQGIDTDKIVDAAAKMIKAAYHAKEDIRAAIEDAIDHIKSHINLDGQAEDHIRAEFSQQADALENKRHLARITSMLKEGATDEQALLHLDRKGVPLYNAVAILGDAKEAQLTPEEKNEALKDAIKKYNTEIEDKWLGEKSLTLIESRLAAKGQQDEIKKTAKENKFLSKKLEEAETPEEKQKIRGAMEAAKDWRNIDKAIHIHLDLKRNPDHYAEFYDKLNPGQKRIADLANNLSPEQTKVVNDIANEYKRVSEMSIDNGLIKDALENYVSRAWDFNGKPGEETFKFATNTRHTMQRSLDTILQGQAEGMKLKTEGATNNLQTLKAELGNVLENKKLLDQAFALKVDSGKTDKNGKPILQSFFSTDARDGYAKVENPFFKKWTYVGKAGEGTEIVDHETKVIGDSILKKKEIYAPKDVAKSLNNILGKSKIEGNKVGDWLTKWSRRVKMSILSASFYHHQAFTRAHQLSGKMTELKAISPISSYKQGLKLMHEKLPEFHELVRGGLTIGRQQDWTEGMSGRGGSEQNKFFQMVDTFHKNLFENYGAGLKAFDGVNLYRHELVKNSKIAEPKTRQQVATNVAKLMNDTYGGENWSRMRGAWLQNPTHRHIVSLGFLAPDWTVSNLRLVINSFKGNEGKIYRNMWARVIARGTMLTVGMNALMTLMDDKDDNGQELPWWQAFEGRYEKAWKSGDLRALAVDMTPIYHLMGGDETQRSYWSFFGAYTDPLKAINNPIHFFENKLSPFGVKMPLEIMTGENWQHKRFTDYDELTGGDDKGQYKKNQKAHFKGDISNYDGHVYKKDQKGHKKGEEEGDKLTGELTKFDYKHHGAISYDQIPSFILSQVRGTMPTAIQSLSQGFTGENDWAKTAFGSVGSGVTFMKEGKKDEEPTLWNLGSKITDKLNR